MAHLAALIFKVNRPLVRSIFTRDVDLDYVRDRHTVWYDELVRNEREAQVKAEVKIQENPINPSNAISQAEVEGEAKVLNLNEIEQRKITDSAVETESIKEREMMANVLKVKGMSCQHCVMSITKALGQLDGVKNVNVDLQKGEVRFENTKGVASVQIEKAITDAGYEVISQSA
jgi:copper ion binding protein